MRKKDVPCSGCGVLMWSDWRRKCDPLCRACRQTRGRFDPTKCGTPEGHRQHRYRGVPVCGPCRIAWNGYCRRTWAAAQARGWVRPGRRTSATTRRAAPCSRCGKTIKASAVEPMCRPCRIHTKRGVDVSDVIRLAIYERDGWTCQFCLEPVDPATKNPDPWAATLDHCIPRSKGGSDEPANLRLLHRWCNTVRRDHTALTWDELVA